MTDTCPLLTPVSHLRRINAETRQKACSFSAFNHQQQVVPLSIILWLSLKNHNNSRAADLRFLWLAGPIGGPRAPHVSQVCRTEGPSKNCVARCTSQP
jgi:hypothetical protein